MLWPLERGLERIAIVARVARRACADDRADFPHAIDHSQRVAAPFQDIKIAVLVGGDGSRIGQRAVGRFCTVGGHALFTVAGDGRDEARCEINRANPPVKRKTDFISQWNM